MHDFILTDTHSKTNVKILWTSISLSGVETSTKFRCPLYDAGHTGPVSAVQRWAQCMSRCNEGAAGGRNGVISTLHITGFYLVFIHDIAARGSGWDTLVWCDIEIDRNKSYCGGTPCHWSVVIVTILSKQGDCLIVFIHVHTNIKCLSMPLPLTRVWFRYRAK